ncbi:MAG: hypothetical protein PHS92_02730 [Candidatus Gracilibacteria bacterium]|nr:hypothetical protein [Candidatus Gracilibacteria bacterium]
MRKFWFIINISLSISLLAFVVAFAASGCSGNICRVDNGTNLSITGPGANGCKIVTNGTSSPIMVPISISGEWDAFLTHLPSNVTANSCSVVGWVVSACNATCPTLGVRSVRCMNGSTVLPDTSCTGPKQSTNCYAPNCSFSISGDCSTIASDITVTSMDATSRTCNGIYSCGGGSSCTTAGGTNLASVPTCTYIYDGYWNDGCGGTGCDAPSTQTCYANTTYHCLSANTGTSCVLPWGGSISSGQSVTAYGATTSSNCAAIAQTRTCTNGVLSGNYFDSSCTNIITCSCNFENNYGDGWCEDFYDVVSSTDISTCQFARSINGYSCDYWGSGYFEEIYNYSDNGYCG